jgi:hypothetical protein
MRVLVCGGLDYTDRAELYAELDRLHAEYTFGMIIAGAAGSVDGGPTPPILKGNT